MTAAPDLHGHAGFRGRRRCVEIVGARPRGRGRLYARTEAAGRGMELQPIPRRSARRTGSGLPVLTPKTLQDDEAAGERSVAFDADVAVVVRLWADPAESHPRGARARLLQPARRPCCRAGAAPRRSNRAVMAGDAQTGVTVMKMDEGLDTGPMAMVERVAIGARHDGRRTARCAGPHRRRSDAARARRAGARHAARFRPQPEDGVTYAAKIDKAETAHRLATALGATPTAIFAACRRFRARGANWRSTASRCGSRCCAPPRARAAARPAPCSSDQLDYRVRRRRGPRC